MPQLSMTKCTSSFFGTASSIVRRNCKNSCERCRRCSSPMTFPVAIFSAANRVVLLCHYGEGAIREMDKSTGHWEGLASVVWPHADSGVGRRALTEVDLVNGGIADKRGLLHAPRGLANSIVAHRSPAGGKFGGMAKLPERIAL